MPPRFSLKSKPKGGEVKQEPGTAAAAAGDGGRASPPPVPNKRERKMLDKMWEKAPWAQRSMKVDYPDLWPQYQQLIAQPMDLGEVRRRLQGGDYQPEPGQAVLPGFQRDVKLVWTNAMRYNQQGTEYHNKAAKVAKWFDQKVADTKLKPSPDKAKSGGGAGGGSAVLPAYTGAGAPVKQEPAASPQQQRKRAAPEGSPDSSPDPPAKRAATVTITTTSTPNANLPAYTEERRVMGMEPIQVLFPDVWDHYKAVVKHPMDLRTVRQNLDAGRYEESDESPRMAPGFVEDVRLVFTNAMQYNIVGTEYHEHAKEMLLWFNNQTAALQSDGQAGGAKPKKPKKDKRQSTEASLAQVAGFKRLWEKHIDLLQELPKTKQSIDKGGPPPLVGNKVQGVAPNPQWPKGRDLRDMNGAGLEEWEDDDDEEDEKNGNKDRKKTIISGAGEPRCLWVVPDGRIFMEAWGPRFKKVEDFLVAIAEPEARPLHIHEFQMTEQSLYAAASMGFGTKHIIEQLKIWSKVELPKDLGAWIKDKTGKYGKVKLVLRENEHHVETADVKIMRTLLKDKRVKECMVKPGEGRDKSAAAAAAGGADAASLVQKTTVELLERQFDEMADDEDVDDVVWDAMDTGVVSKKEKKKKKKKKKTREVEHFSIAPGKYRDIKKACNDIGYPIIEEYDYKADKKPLKGASARRIDKSRTGLELKSADYVRDYQAKCLNKMFGSNGRARSGLIVLPCGAGKSFVGVTAACTVNKKTMVLCPTGLSVDQWKFQFENWTNCLTAGVRVEGFTSTSLRDKDEEEVRTMMKADVIITTYTALTAGRDGQRGRNRQLMLHELENEHEFGLMILDEVHMLPAAEFQKSLDKLKAHCKLGLTATLVREDDKINDLRFLIGPKIYEANWMELQKAGYLAKVQCHEVQCPMAADFYGAYLAARKPAGAAAAEQGGSIFHKEQMLYIMNPNKLMAAHHLILKHKKLGHKIIVFSDRIFPLEVLSKALDQLDQKLPIGHPERLGAGRIDGSCEAWERQKLMDSFKNNADDHVILLSKVGDAALDMPDANVIIQIASSGASRMQEAQRLGRILRPKSTQRRGDEPEAFFYSLVSQDTHEMRFSTARQRYLVEQGYAFHVHPPDDTGVCGEAERECEILKSVGKPPLLFSKREDQKMLLREIEDAGESGANFGEDEDKEGKLKKAADELKKLLQGNKKLAQGNNAAIFKAVGRR